MPAQHPVRSQPASRRQRRAAARAATRDAARQPSTSGLRRRPLLVITMAALAVGLFAVGALLVLNRPAARGSTLQTPTFMTPTDLADGTSLGAKSAPVTIDLWADFQCPVCQAFTDQIEPQLVTTYIEPGKVRLVFHDMAFIGPESVDAAVAAQAAAAQGKFWTYHDYLYANQGVTENSGAFSRARLISIADAVGLNQAKFTQALDDATLRNDVEAEASAGASQGVNATPTIFLNGKFFQAGIPTWSALSAAIDQLLPASASPSASPSPSTP
jgi:protein-disulfide isomerase